MTSEPNGGYYGENGVTAFVRKYGYTSSADRLVFTGMHKLGSENQKTRLTLTLSGLDVDTNKIEDVGGAVALLDAKGAVAASWNIANCSNTGAQACVRGVCTVHAPQYAIRLPLRQPGFAWGGHKLSEIPRGALLAARGLRPRLQSGRIVHGQDHTESAKPVSYLAQETQRFV